MAERAETRPWEALDALVGTGDATRLEAFLDLLSPSETARALAHLNARIQTRVLETLTAEGAADVLDDLPISQAAALVDQLPTDVAAAIVHELPSDEQADLIVEMDQDRAQAVLGALDPREAGAIRTLAEYAEDVAGGLMLTEVIAIPTSATTLEVVERFRRQVEAWALAVQYVYVVDEIGRLLGVLRIRDLLVAPADATAESIMIREPVSVLAETGLEELVDIFDERTFMGLPVVDGEGRLLGLVTETAVRDAAGERAEADHLKAVGIVGGEELRTMPLLTRSRRRLSWLSINIVLNVIAASVIAVFEDTLTAVIALAFFLPIISDMSGCSGNQAVAVSVRELALGLVKPFEVGFVWLKEVGIGLINGTVLGVLIGVVAWVWRGNPYLGVVVGLALMLNTMIAVSIGGAVPLLLKRFKMDPALASGPVLTTVTDICGFLLVLGLATAMLPRLV